MHLYKMVQSSIIYRMETFQGTVFPMADPYWLFHSSSSTLLNLSWCWPSFFSHHQTRSPSLARGYVVGSVSTVLDPVSVPAPA